MRSPQTMKLLARLQGIIIGCCMTYGIPFYIYAPSAWRKQLGFKQARTTREELKQQAVCLVHDTYKISVSTDEAEAICIAMSHIKHLEGQNKDDKE